MTLKFRRLLLELVWCFKIRLLPILIMSSPFADFLSMKVVGELMRKAGAFYMRRSFAHDKLYWYVLKEYVQNLVKHFHSGMEFFLEGTRSRSMKALPPKVGLLSMAVEPFFMGELSDITIVPVSISYERPLEEKLFVDELMGVPKPKETTVGLIKSLREISNNEYGKIYIRVQDSMSLRKYVKERTDRMKYSVEPAHVQTLATDDMAVVQDLAYYIIDLQQKFIVIHLINLVTLYVAFRRFSMKDTITLVELCDGVLLLSRIFERMGAITNVDPSKIRQDIQTTLRIHKRIFAVENDCLVLKKPLVEVDKIKNMRFKAHRLNDGSMQQCVPVFSLQIYINPCLYWTALPTIILVSQKQLSDNGSVPVDVNVLRGKVQLLRKLYEREFVFYEKQEEQEFFEKLNQLQNFNLLEYVPNRDEVVYNKDASDLEKYLMSVLSPYVTTYYQVVTILGQYFNEDQEFTENEFLVKMQMEMEFRLAHQQEFIHPYALCLETLSNALHSLVALKAVQKERDPKKTTFQIVRPNLLPFVDLLRSICQLMPFNYLYDYNPVSSLAYKL